MILMMKKIILTAGLALVSTYLSACANNHPVRTAVPEQVPSLVVTPFPESPLKESIIAGGDYLVRNQLSNGHLSYQINIETHRRDAFPSFVRLIGGNGALYTACRVSARAEYCQAGDRALDYYLVRLAEDPQRFDGACFSEENDCSLGGSALAIDAIYKRWQAMGNFTLGDRNLLDAATQLGNFLVWMRRPEGGFYHSFDPFYGGAVDPDAFVKFFPGESLMALLELYEMTGDDAWLKQAREVNDYMIQRPVDQDHWHAYAFNLFARLDHLTKDDITYAIRIGEAVLQGEQESLAHTASTISTATRLEATASLGQALALSDSPHAWLAPAMEKIAQFELRRQLPENDCGWITSSEMSVNYAGGIYLNCIDPIIRVDGLMHWINGAAAYLEYQEMIR